MYKNTLIEIDPDPHQGGASPASTHNPIFNNVPAGLLAGQFLASQDRNHVEIKKLKIEDAQAFFDNHTYRRITLPPEQQCFMKELKPGLLEKLIEKKMPVIGVFENGKMVSGCAILYPSDQDIDSYLAGYDFGDEKNRTAVISAVWTHPDHGGKGYSKKAINAGMEIALIAGKGVFRAKVDKGNKASLAIFDWFDFDVTKEGQDPQKVYPILAL
jgi:RimJ/RimL family protein N-acetyltransferase